jgi:hypothetical protein
MPDNEQRSVTPFWLASPLLLAMVGLIGTGVGAVLQGFWNTRLEREKFEFSLIEKALATSNKDEAAQNLKFLVDAGLINQFNQDKIASLASNPKALPDFLGGRNLISVRAGKAVLSGLGIYKGPINDEDNGAYRNAIADFQKSQNLAADGMVGPVTFDRMRLEYQKTGNAWPDQPVPR